MESVTVDVEEVVRKIRALPAERVAEVEDFVDFLAAKTRDRAFADFLSVANNVAQAGVEPLTTDQIEAEIKALRGERRGPTGT